MFKYLFRKIFISKSLRACISASGIKIKEFVVPEKSNFGETVKLICDVDNEETPMYVVNWFIDGILIAYTSIESSTATVLQTSGVNAEVLFFL